jgi:hypothetical protein
MKKGRPRTSKSPPPKPPVKPPLSAKSPWWLRLEFLAAAALSLWIVFLHFQYLFHAGPLWRDEVGTIDFASMPTLADIWHNLQYDNFPPLFVLVARLWMLAGMSGDFGCRTLGFLIGLGTLGVIWLGARAGGARVPLLALALYALNPLAIRVGDSMRPYGVGIVLTLLVFVLTWKFVKNPRPRTLLWAVIAAVLSVQCLYQNAVFVAAFSLGAWAVTLVRRQWKAAAQTCVIGGVAALSLLPHLSNILKGQDWLEIAKRPATFEQMLTVLAYALDGSGPWLAWLWAGLAMLAAGIVIRSILLIRPIGPAAGRMLYSATAILASALLYALFLRQIGLKPSPWYFLILIAPAALALDVILSAENLPPIRLGRVGLCALTALVCGPACLAGVQWRQTNADLVAQTLQTQSQPGDMILVSPWYFGVSLQRYFGTNRFDTLPPMAEVRIHRYDLMKQQMASENPIGPLLDQVRQTLRSGHALWVVGVFQFPPPGPPQPVYGPYHGGMELPDSTYFSSWMFQISQIVQTRATSGGEVKIRVPASAKINPLEEMPLLVFRGWKE